MNFVLFVQPNYFINLQFNNIIFTSYFYFPPFGRYKRHKTQLANKLFDTSGYHLHVLC
jgi:hypothetical protein